jgi:hypothetical protein
MKPAQDRHDRPTLSGMTCLVAALFALLGNNFASAEAPPFGGRPSNLSTGNLSVTFVQHTPIGAFPQPDYLEPSPAVTVELDGNPVEIAPNSIYENKAPH